MATICALNNYPLKKMWELSQGGLMPGQHVWGLDALAADGHVIDFAPFHEPGDRSLLERLSFRTRGVLGHLDQEAYALRRVRSTDVLYCADQAGLAGIALGRRVLPTTQLVSVVHHPLGNAVRLATVRRTDTLICLSRTLCSELERALPRRRATVVHLPWGPDLASPLYEPLGEGNGIVSAGKSNRDLITLAQALAGTESIAVVYDLERQLAAPPNDSVRVVHPGDPDGIDPVSHGAYLARRVVRDIAASSIVAIPVRDPGRLTGLTEATDALALAKPIVATRSPYFPFDIEAVGCGIWVQPGDAQGWARAIRRLLSDPDARKEMGSTGRRFAEREWNYGSFHAGLSELVSTPRRQL